MPEIIRSIAAGLSQTLTKLTTPNTKQKNAKLLVEVAFDAAALPFGASAKTKDLSINGFTRCLGFDEISFVVDSIRLNEHYLVDHGVSKRLKLAIELPNGEHIRLIIAPKCYRSIETADETMRYLIEAKIVSVNEAERARYHNFLSAKNKASETVAKPMSLQKKSVLSILDSIF